MREIGSVEEMRTFASKVVQKLTRGSTATVLALSGDLGAGKTTFVQGLARSLGTNVTITSPTFVILKRYPLSKQAFDTLIHIDAYRLNSSSELQKLGWEEILKDAGSLVVLEWPERVSECIPDNAQTITFTHKNEGSRIVSYE